MKKVFACLSTVLLMLVAFGLFMQPAAKLAAADVEEGKFIEDPTIEEGDIPVYVMNSIRTTFPNLYDQNALKDPIYEVGRDYYWNEIKLVVPVFVDNQATGQQYTVYTQGSYNASKKTAAASKIYIWYEIPEGKENAGQIVTATQTGQSIAWTGQYAPLFGDSSLSGVRYNVTGKEVEINDIARENGIGNGDHGNDVFYLIFDGSGKAVRGSAHDKTFTEESHNTYGFESIFGYQDGKIVLRTDIVKGAALNGFGASDEELDRVQHEEDDLDNPLVDEITGEPVLDDDGNPVYNKKLVDGEEAKILYGQRYVFQWYSEDEFDAEMVNDVQFLEEGWRYDKWDYAYADPNGGYVCLAFTAALGKFAALSDKQSEVHNASIRALQEAGELDEDAANALLIGEEKQEDEETHEETIKYDVVERPLIQSCVIPVDGISYRFGYLDYIGGAEIMYYTAYQTMYEQALLFGRNEAYRAHARTYNLTATGLVAKSKVVDDNSFILREENGQLIYEVKAGAVVKPAELIDVTGMLGGYGIVGDGEKGTNVAAVQSYKNAEVTDLQYTMDIAGKPVMRPVQLEYDSFDDFAAALKAACNAAGITSKWSAAKVVEFLDANEQFAWVLDYMVAVNGEGTYEGHTLAEEVALYKEGKTNAEDGFDPYFIVVELVGMFNKNSQNVYSAALVGADYSQADIQAKYADYCPNKFKYETWDEFVEAFLDAFNDYVYGREQVEDASQWWDMTYTADADLQAKQIAFFAQPAWKFLSDTVDEIIADQEWTSYNKTHYYYYRCTMFAFLNKTKRTSWPASVDCTDMENPGWIGKPAVWEEVEFDTGTYTAPSNFELTLTCLNAATGISDDMKLTFEVVDVFTPYIRVDESALRVALGQESIDLRAAVKAYDGEYQGDSIYGGNISRQYLEFVLPEGFDPNHLTSGTFKVKAVAYAPANPAVKAEESFTIRVIDGVAPTAEARSEVYVVKGAQLKAEDILLYAHDDLAGDLFTNADWIWYLIDTDYDPMTSEIGEELEGKITIYDLNQNELVKRFTVIVTGAEGVDNSEEIGALEERLADLEAEVAKANKLQEADAKLADIQAKIAQLESKLGEVANNAEQTVSNTTKGCKKAGMLVAGLVAAAGLVLVIFKKKH